MSSLAGSVVRFVGLNWNAVNFPESSMARPIENPLLNLARGKTMRISCARRRREVKPPLSECRAVQTSCYPNILLFERPAFPDVVSHFLWNGNGAHGFHRTVTRVTRTFVLNWQCNRPGGIVTRIRFGSSRFQEIVTRGANHNWRFRNLWYAKRANGYDWENRWIDRILDIYARRWHILFTPPRYGQYLVGCEIKILSVPGRSE